MRGVKNLAQQDGSCRGVTGGEWGVMAAGSTMNRRLGAVLIVASYANSRAVMSRKRKGQLVVRFIIHDVHFGNL